VLYCALLCFTVLYCALLCFTRYQVEHPFPYWLVREIVAPFLDTLTLEECRKINELTSHKSLICMVGADVNSALISVARKGYNLAVHGEIPTRNNFKEVKSYETTSGHVITISLSVRT
jgi:hypothetical protein